VVIDDQGEFLVEPFHTLLHVKRDGSPQRSMCSAPENRRLDGKVAETGWIGAGAGAGFSEGWAGFGGLLRIRRNLEGGASVTHGQKNLTPTKKLPI